MSESEEQQVIEISCIYNCGLHISGSSFAEVYNKAEKHLQEAHRVDFNNMAIEEEIGGRLSEAIKSAMGKKHWED